MGHNRFRKKYFFLIILLIAGFIQTYSIHFDYRFPYHQDEWQHIAISKQIIEEGYNKQFNPYLGRAATHPDLESGFHLFLSEAIILTDLDPILYYQFLPAIFAVFSMLAIFYTTHKLTDNFFIGIISTAVFLSLKSNVNILGRDFFVPLTMAIPFIFLYIYYFVFAIKEKNIKKSFIAIFFLFILLLVHPPSFAILVLPSIAELFFQKDSLDIVKKKPGYIILFLSFFVVLGMGVLWKGSFSGTYKYLIRLLYFEPGWGILEVKYFVPLLYGLANTFFAIIGFIKGYKTKLRFFVLMSFFSLAITSFFNKFGFTYFVPYSRAIHYSMLGMVPLTAFGLVWSFDKIKNARKIKNKEVRKYTSTLLVVVFFILIFTSTYNWDEKYKKYTYTVIDEQAYETLLWMKNNIPQDNVFITPYFMTSSVYPISGHKVMKLIPAILRSQNNTDNLDFYTDECTKRKETVERNNVDYVYSRQSLDCTFLEIVYDEKDNIYKVLS